MAAKDLSLWASPCTYVRTCMDPEKENLGRDGSEEKAWEELFHFSLHPLLERIDSIQKKTELFWKHFIEK